MKYPNFRYQKPPLMASLALAVLVPLTSVASAATISDPTLTPLTANSSFSIDATATDFYIFGENAKKKGGPAAFTDVSATPSGSLSNASTSTVKVAWTGGDRSDSTGSTKYDAVGFGSSFNPRGTEAKFTLTMPSAEGTLDFWLIPNGNTKDIKYRVTVGNKQKELTGNNISYQRFTYKITQATPGETITVTVNNVIGGNVWHNIGFQAAQLIVSKATQTVSFVTPPSRGTVGKTVDLNVQASSGLTNIALTSTSDVCTVSNRQVTFTAAGTCKITANQAGNANYQAAQASLEILVANAATVSKLTDKTVGDAEFPLNAQSTAGLPVELTLDPQSQGICTLNGTLVTPVSIGTCIIHAFQPGNATTNPAQAEYRFEITGEPQEQTLSVQLTPNDGIVGDVLSITATPGESGNEVTFASITPETCQVQGSSATLLQEGTCTVTANQAGNQQYLEATASSSVIVKTDKATFNLAVSSNKNNSGQLTEVSQADTVNIDLKITAAPRDVGKTVEAYLTAKFGDKGYILTEQGWNEWDGKTYQSAKSVTLDAQAQTVPAFSDQFPFAGTLEFFAAYGNAGVVAQGPQAVGTLTVTAPVPAEQVKTACLETGGIYYAQQCFTDLKKFDKWHAGGIYVEGQPGLQTAVNLPCRLGHKIAVLVRSLGSYDTYPGQKSELQLDFQLEGSNKHGYDVKSTAVIPRNFNVALFERELPTVGTYTMTLTQSIFFKDRGVTDITLPPLTVSARLDSCEYPNMQLNILPLGHGNGEVMTKINDDGSVRLTATAATDRSIFAGWTGDAEGCKGGETTVTIKPTADKFTCQPTFNKQVLGTLKCKDGFDSEQNVACCDLQDPKCPAIPEPCNPPKETEVKWLVNVPNSDATDVINIRITNLADKDSGPIIGTLYDSTGKAIFTQKVLIEWNEDPQKTISLEKMAAFQTVVLTAQDIEKLETPWTGRALLKIEAPDIGRLSVMSFQRGKVAESPLMNMTPYTTKHRVFHIPPQKKGQYGVDVMSIRITNIGATPMNPVIRLFDSKGLLIGSEAKAKVMTGIASLATLRLDSKALTDLGFTWTGRVWAEIVPADVTRRCNGKMLIQALMRQQNVPGAPLSNVTPVDSQ